MFSIRSRLASFLLVPVLVSGVVVPPPFAVRTTYADDTSPVKSDNVSPKEVRKLLEQWRDAGSLPEGVVVRVSACLGELRDNQNREKLPESLLETWEFSAQRVHRITRDSSDDDSNDGGSEAGNSDKRQADLRPFDTKALCQAFLDTKGYEIPSQKGVGPRTLLIGSPYDRGSRVITIQKDGHSILDLHETNGPAFVAYAESDARTFGTLYERLAGQARAAFTSSNGKSK